MARSCKACAPSGGNFLFQFDNRNREGGVVVSGFWGKYGNGTCEMNAKSLSTRWYKQVLLQLLAKAHFTVLPVGSNKKLGEH